MQKVLAGDTTDYHSCTTSTEDTLEFLKKYNPEVYRVIELKTNKDKRN